MIRDAAVLSSVGVNIARAVGPAIAGLVIAHAGVPFVFAANVVSFAVFLLVMVLWRGYRPPVARPQPFVDATLAGLRYVWNAAVVRQMLVQLALFMIPANALWALLPIVASGSLQLDANGYGALLAALGCGSIGGAFLMPRLRLTLGENGVVIASSVVFGAAMIVLATIDEMVVIVPVLVVAGIAWIGVVTTLNGTVQAFLPSWVRARGLSLYQLVLFGCTAIGAAVSGSLATAFGVMPTMLGAGVITVLTGAWLLVRPLRRADADRSSSSLAFTDLPPLLAETDVETEDRPVLVSVRYHVSSDNHAEFIQAMSDLGRSRRRTGAASWSLYEDPAAAGSFIEQFTVRSWREHESQHDERQTGYDRSLLERARHLTVEPVTVQHWLRVTVPRHSSE